MDEWGYPVVSEEVPPALTDLADRAVEACPTLALLLSHDSASNLRRRP
jgi:ferredoxin